EQAGGRRPLVARCPHRHLPRAGAVVRGRHGRAGLLHRRGVPRGRARQGRDHARPAGRDPRRPSGQGLGGARARHDAGPGHRGRRLRQARPAGELRPGAADRPLRERGPGDQADPAADHPRSRPGRRPRPARGGRGRRGEGRLMRRREDMTFSPREYERRVRELRERMAARRLDAVIISDPENRMYHTDHQTTGYSFFQALIVPLEAEPVMITRALEESNVIARTWLENSRGYPDTGDAILELVSTLRDLRLGDSRVGDERNSYYFQAYQQDRFHDAFGEGLVDCFGIVEAGRIRTSPDEAEVLQLTPYARR